MLARGREAIDRGNAIPGPLNHQSLGSTWQDLRSWVSKAEWDERWLWSGEWGQNISPWKEIKLPYGRWTTVNLSSRRESSGQVWQGGVWCAEKGKDEGWVVNQAQWLLPWPEAPELGMVLWPPRTSMESISAAAGSKWFWLRFLSLFRASGQKWRCLSGISLRTLISSSLLPARTVCRTPARGSVKAWRLGTQ